MDQSLTVVLPLQNAERTVRKDVLRTLEASAELTSMVEVLLVDDASSDDTFDVASELAIEFPQVRVIRRSRKGGLADALEQIKQTVVSDIVIVHDGQSRVNPEQLRRIWTQQQMMGMIRNQGEPRGVSFADLRRPAATQPMMAEAHRRLLGFQRVTVDATASSSNMSNANTTDPMARRDAPSASEPSTGKGVGGIPPLPKANLFGVISDFARGE